MSMDSKYLNLFISFNNVLIKFGKSRTNLLKTVKKFGIVHKL